MVILMDTIGSKYKFKNCGIEKNKYCGLAKNTVPPQHEGVNQGITDTPLVTK
jgi:hypothetical protein